MISYNHPVILIEGLDGVGKSTLVRSLAAHIGATRGVAAKDRLPAPRSAANTQTIAASVPLALLFSTAASAATSLPECAPVGLDLLSEGLPTTRG